MLPFSLSCVHFEKANSSRPYSHCGAPKPSRGKTASTTTTTTKPHLRFDVFSRNWFSKNPSPPAIMEHATQHNKEITSLPRKPIRKFFWSWNPITHLRVGIWPARNVHPPYACVDRHSLAQKRPKYLFRYFRYRNVRAWLSPVRQTSTASFLIFSSLLTLTLIFYDGSVIPQCPLPRNILPKFPTNKARAQHYRCSVPSRSRLKAHARMVFLIKKLNTRGKQLRVIIHELGKRLLNEKMDLTLGGIETCLFVVSSFSFILWRLLSVHFVWCFDRPRWAQCPGLPSAKHLRCVWLLVSLDWKEVK